MPNYRRSFEWFAVQADLQQLLFVAVKYGPPDLVRFFDNKIKTVSH